MVNDSGVYLPPSPTSERDAFWSSSNGSGHGHGHGHGHRRTYITSLSSLSRSSMDNAAASPTGADRTSPGDIEPFTISRESFDSYRRSFDISAKSPVSPVFAAGEWGPGGFAGRQSLDSATRRPIKSSALKGSSSSMQQTRFPPADEGFEDVGLDDGRNNSSQQTTGHSVGDFIKKRGAFFSKFGGDHSADNATSGSSGRKRGQSGQGAELKPMDRDTSRPLDSMAAPAQAQEVQS